jgi:hypothetical protein
VPLVPLLPLVPPVPLVPLLPLVPPVPLVPLLPLVPPVPLEPLLPLVPPVPLVPLLPPVPPVPLEPLLPVPIEPLEPLLPLPIEPLVPLVPLVASEPLCFLCFLWAFFGFSLSLLVVVALDELPALWSPICEPLEPLCCPVVLLAPLVPPPPCPAVLLDCAWTVKPLNIAATTDAPSKPFKSLVVFISFSQ